MDGAVRLNVHFHILCADGAWVTTEKGVEFLQAPPIQQHIVEEVFADILKQRAATSIAAGHAKYPCATVEGRWIADPKIPHNINAWTPVGYNPKKASFFYDKRSRLPVLSGAKAIAVGSTVFVLAPVYA